MTRLPTAFAATVAPASWPPPRGAPRPSRIEAPVDVIRGVGARLASQLNGLGLGTVEDLLLHAPFRHEPAVPERRLADLLVGEEVAVSGRVVTVTARRPRRRLTIVTALVDDGSDRVPCVWFNQEWLAEKLQPGTHVRLRGRLGSSGFQVRTYDLGEASATADFAPVYPAGEALTPKRIRTLVGHALARLTDVVDPVPAAVLGRLGFPSRRDALGAIHRPRSLADAELARRRLAFDELLILHLGLARRRRAREGERAPALPPPGELVARFRAVLPFELTESQEHAIAELDRDLERPVPMERLLQGDVGAGKTVVALYALLRAVEGGGQGALMAPTETLAEQHFLTIERWCGDLGVPCVLLTSSLPAREHAAARDAIAAGDARIAVGTHALIQRDVAFRELAVAVVDEQHRFGVEQRTALAEGRRPHVLHMTATPIPRTLALTVYGDLAVSELARPPASRKPVRTGWVTAERSSEAYTRLRRHLAEGRQAYVVCPLVTAGKGEARAAEQEAERLRAAELAGFRVGCIHGKLKARDRRDLMARFTAGELDVLVATTVIEVGVDVPNATIMIVQEADRFGLAQLHQLRGRVGRGAEQSYCLLVSRPREELTEIATERLQALVDTTDGFELAERDLELRGAGELAGVRQSGATDFRFVRLRQDRKLLEQARRIATDLRVPNPALDNIVANTFDRAMTPA